MKKAIGMVGMILMAGMAYSAPLVGKVVGKAIGRVTAREVTETAAKQSLKSSARSMSSALAGVTAKQLMGAGLGTGIAVGVPIAAYKLSDGQQEIDKARAEAIRKTSEAVVLEMPNHPELVGKVLPGSERTVGFSLSQIRDWFGEALPWACGVAALVCLLYLAGFLLRTYTYFRRGWALVAAVKKAPTVPGSIATEEIQTNA